MPRGNPRPVLTPEFEAAKIKRSDDTTESLAKRQTQVRLPVSVDVAIAQLGQRKAAWLRRVITEAAQQELMSE